MSDKISIFWFRRDLRTVDNRGLQEALKGDCPVLPLFIFDTEILSQLDDTRDARVQFIHREIEDIKHKLEDNYGTSMLIRHGNPLEVWKNLVDEYDIAEVYANRDYEPYARQRDKSVYEFLEGRDIRFRGFKDHVLLEKSEVLKDDGDPYVVFTPYKKTYKSLLRDEHFTDYAIYNYTDNFKKSNALDSIALEEMGFEAFDFEYPGRTINREIIENYHNTRDIPAEQGTTRLSMHLRFGTISIRKLGAIAREANEKYFDELIWRDFYQMILYHFPRSIDNAFREKYDDIAWEKNEEHFEAWCAGKTGYPLVDAAMRELNTTGWMHNRMRMLTASFLTKHLLIDWRWGERYFASKLLDYEAASNVGGWQWAAGSGVDAAPYFRIFSPERQKEKFDKEEKYIRQYVEEFGSSGYPTPIVDHKAARERALNRYQQAVKQ